MNHGNLIAVTFITASFGLGALVACGKGGEAAAKDPSTQNATPAPGETTGLAGASKDKTAGAGASGADLKGAMGGGSDRSAAGDTPRGPVGTAAPGPNVGPKNAPAPLATQPTGPAPKNTGDPPPDPNRQH